MPRKNDTSFELWCILVGRRGTNCDKNLRRVDKLSTLALVELLKKNFDMKPEIKKYLNVFQYLQDIYTYRKSIEKLFSYDQWAQELSASDKSYIRFMVLGKRHINARMTQVFAENLKLDLAGTEYFKNLVAYSQCKTHEEKTLFGKKIISLLRSDFSQQEMQAHFDFLSNKILPRLQVLLSFQDMDQSLEKLSWLLGADEAEVAQGLKTLEELGFITRENDKIISLKRSFKVGDRFGDLGLEAFYVNSLEEAQEAIRLPKETRRFKSLFLPLNNDEFSEFVQSINGFSQEQLSRYNPNHYAGRRLYQVHMHIVPVTQEQAESSLDKTAAELS